MSIKSFLQAKEMQTGGMLQQSFTGPFANQSRRDPSGAEYIPPTYAPPKPPTITIDPIAPTPAAPTAEETAKLDPGTVGSHADYNYNVTDAIAGASKAGMGNLTPAQIGMLEPEFAASLAATVQPETDLSRFTDKAFKSALTPALAVATLAVPAVAPMTGLFSAVTGRGGSGILSSALSAMGSKPAAPQQIAGTGQFGPLAPAPIGTQETSQFTGKAITPSGIFATTPGVQYSKGDKGAPIMTSFYGTPFGADKAAIARGEAASQESVAAVSTAGVGAGMFDAFGMGGEISPNFAIGGKGSFTSFSHYGAGISQADEISIAQSGIANNSSGFETPEASKDTIDAMVADGYNESAVVAVATGMGTEGKPDFDAGFSDPGGSPVICTQLFSMGIMSANLYQGEGEHAKNIPNVIRRGYHFWAVPFVRGMRKNQLLFKLGKTLGLSWAQYAAHKANPDKFAPNYLGTFINAIGIPICAALGLFVGETDWETLWIDYEKGNGLCLDQQN